MRLVDRSKFRICIFSPVKQLRYLKELNARPRLKIRCGTSTYPTFWIAVYTFSLPLHSLWARHRRDGPIKLAATPHFQFLNATKDGRVCKLYADYFDSEPPHFALDASVREHNFLALQRSLLTDSTKVLIQVLASRPEDQIYILDGVHRASILLSNDPLSNVECVVPLVWIVRRDKRGAA